MELINPQVENNFFIDNEKDQNITEEKKKK